LRKPQCDLPSSIYGIQSDTKPLGRQRPNRHFEMPYMYLFLTDKPLPTRPPSAELFGTFLSRAVETVGRIYLALPVMSTLGIRVEVVAAATTGYYPPINIFIIPFVHKLEGVNLPEDGELEITLPLKA
jgi:hypothetical protein